MSRDWRELTRCDSLAEAHTIATSIEAMEYDVRLRTAFSDEPIDIAAMSNDPDASGPFVIDARGADWADLAGVLQEIIAEQFEFDDGLRRRDRAVNRVRWTLLSVALAGGVVTVLYLVLRDP